MLNECTMFLVMFMMLRIYTGEHYVSAHTCCFFTIIMDIVVGLLMIYFYNMNIYYIMEYDYCIYNNSSCIFTYSVYKSSYVEITTDFII